MFNRKEIKQNTRAILNRNSSWAAGFLAILVSGIIPIAIFFVLSLIVGLITNADLGAASAYLNFATTDPMQSYALFTNSLPVGFGIGMAIITFITAIFMMASRLGQRHYFLNLIRSQNPHVSNVFSWYKRFVKAFLAFLYYSIRLFLWTLPSYACYFVSGLLAYNGSTILSGIFAFIGSVLIFVLLVPKAFSYAMYLYVLNDNPDMPLGEAIKASTVMMQGYRMEYFVFKLSFILWYLLETICFIATIYVAPYTAAADAMFYDTVKNIAMGNGGLAPATAAV